MESLLCVLLLALLLLIYFSNRQNAINRWCALAIFVFWLGLAKEAISYNLLPSLEGFFSVSLMDSFIYPYSLMTWALYALAVPTATLFAFALGGALPPLSVRWLFYLPAAILSAFFYPWQFHLYQQSSAAFWLAFAVYNLSGCVFFTVRVVLAVRRETDFKTRKQKRLVGRVLLPPVWFWALSVFLTHPFYLTNLNKLWQVNAFILLGCIVFYVAVAFRGGMMGLRLTGESYRWNSDMSLIRKSAFYTGHMIKNQTAKMTWCVENLTNQCFAQDTPPPEELTILSRAITQLQDYCEKNSRYADAILLSEAPHSLAEMLRDAFALCAHPLWAESPLTLTGVDPICWYCDRTHMTEVFVNLFTNALESTSAPSPIEVSGALGRGNTGFTLKITDHGAGMSPEDAACIFNPYFTTKRSPHNLGLGLAYCQNVIQKHEGTLKAQSKEGQGTVMVIRLPADRVFASPAEGGKEAADE